LGFGTGASARVKTSTPPNTGTSMMRIDIQNRACVPISADGSKPFKTDHSFCISLEDSIALPPAAGH
jgi:hypothetical protein